MIGTFMTRAALAFGIALAATAPSWASSYEQLKPEHAHEIRARLAAEGYEVRRIEAEDGMIEVYALRDGKRYELYLDRDLTVVHRKQDR